jgi:UDP-2,3-diacylglucosamine hydrolase
MPQRTKIYFASDFHLGLPDHASSRSREDRIVRWLDLIKADAAEVYLVGDIFDFWFEYNKAIPKGFIRFQGKLAELVDFGIKITFFRGNHDMWMFDYFTQELGVEIHSNELIFERNGKRFYLHHGDGLGPGDSGFKIMKKFFRSNFCQWLFARIHPNLGLSIGQSWSLKRRVSHSTKEFNKEEHEWLVTYSKELLEKEYFDYLIFGHRHLPLDISIGKSRYINLGEWIHYNSYAVFDGEEMRLEYFEKDLLLDKAHDPAT